MAETTDATSITPRDAQLDSIAEEFLHNSPRGRRLVAVEAEDAGLASRFADDLAASLDRHGQHAVRISTGDLDEAELRADVIEPFRAQTLAIADGADTVLVADGRRLLNEHVKGIWHFAVWVLTGDELPHPAANVIVDATDEAAPTRYFYDYCRLPPSIGELR